MSTLFSKYLFENDVAHYCAVCVVSATQQLQDHRAAVEALENEEERSREEEVQAQFEKRLQEQLPVLLALYRSTNGPQWYSSVV